ncbi:hypothetical protein LIER_05886 [Lithospermum erythrorhizon]|uniref:DUF4219 domain-containing protein n=1 Tax=Lithospermum erythrorhizon TaxID=34254 RepID=A0AAV3P735_LITER
MADFTNSLATVEKLNNNNWGSWSTRMKFYLVGQDLWDIISGSDVTPPTPDPGEVRKWKIKGDPDNAIIETRMKKIIIDRLRLEYKGIVTTTRDWATKPTLVDLENLLMNEEELDRPSSRYVRDEEEALFINKRDSWGRGQDRGRSSGMSFNQEGSQSRCVQARGDQGVRHNGSSQQRWRSNSRQSVECYSCGKK